MKRMLMWTMAVAALLGASPIEARAQMSMGSFKGLLTGHIGAASAGDVDNARATVGASVAVHEENGWGAEIDFGHTADADSGRQVLDLTSYMVNAAFTRPNGLVRPFGVAGAGILQINGCNSPCNRAARTYDLGVTAGAGVYVVTHDAFAFRADARYFFSSAEHRDLNRPDNFAYWRFSFGATYMWAIAP